MRDRVNALLNFQPALFGADKTTVGVLCEGRKGKPGSWTITNDLNGDNLAGNDLMHILSALGSGDVVIKGDTAPNHANEKRFWAVVHVNQELRDDAGTVVGRNKGFAP